MVNATSEKQRTGDSKSIRDCFESLVASEESLTNDKLEKCAMYAGLTVEEAAMYIDALRTVKFFEAKFNVQHAVSEE